MVRRLVLPVVPVPMRSFVPILESVVGVVVPEFIVPVPVEYVPLVVVPLFIVPVVPLFSVPVVVPLFMVPVAGFGVV